MLTMMDGIVSGTKKRLDDAYQAYDSELPSSKVLQSRFQTVLDDIDAGLGDRLAKSAFRRRVLFYSLYSACYDQIFGLGTKPTGTRRKATLPRDFGQKIAEVDQKIRGKRLPSKVQDAIDKATADVGRRTTRHGFLMEALGLVSAQ